MRIAFINPPSLFTYGKINSGHNCSFPLGLGYIAAYARKYGHQTAIFDPEASRTPISSMWNMIHDFNPDMIGITSVTSNFMSAKELVEQAKKKIGCAIIMGGPHATALPGSTLRAIPSLNAVICGEGEIPVRLIADRFDRVGKFDVREVPGAAFLENGNLIQLRRSVFTDDLDEFPPPARDLVDLSWYVLQPHFQRGEKSATILSSRGCPSRCTFCGNTGLGRRFRPRTPLSFVNELEDLTYSHGIKHFHIVDDCFTYDPRRMEAICDLIISRRLKITWFAFGRVDTLQDENLLNKMRLAGCVYVLLGIESGNQTILDIMKKDIKIAEIKKCCALLDKCRIKYFNSFIIGNEGDSESTILETIDFAKKLKSVMAGFNILIPFPGTAIFAKYFKDLDRPETDWNNFCSVGDTIPYDPRQTKSLTRKDLMRLVSTAYREYYLNFRRLYRIMAFAYNPKIFRQYLRGAFALTRQVLSWRKKGNI